MPCTLLLPSLSFLNLFNPSHGDVKKLLSSKTKHVFCLVCLVCQLLHFLFVDWDHRGCLWCDNFWLDHFFKHSVWVVFIWKISWIFWSCFTLRLLLFHFFRFFFKVHFAITQALRRSCHRKPFERIRIKIKHLVLLFLRFNFWLNNFLPLSWLLPYFAVFCHEVDKAIPILKLPYFPNHFKYSLNFVELLILWQILYFWESESHFFCKTFNLLMRFVIHQCSNPSVLGESCWKFYVNDRFSRICNFNLRINCSKADKVEIKVSKCL